MRWSECVEQVREFGQYPTTREAERVIRVVLSALGGHLGDAERAALAARLPPEAARVLGSQVPASRPLRGAEFVEHVALRLGGAGQDTARWDVSSVLSTVAQLAGDELTDRIIDRLPEGYALLFGRAQLV
ncbi:DUF2267 domain-containing protein [Streptomyces aidingensis]|uniref:Uncharacterized conserved protein, DUF2267 family n=1 Tax=Streptomyces aidingensis TaxID=910347 RepID=A0A1I1R1D2_9ACTN|nr:Uncharacterized conserved protein, DUF2267 family [Streptomyces aidingensis]